MAMPPPRVPPRPRVAIPGRFPNLDPNSPQIPFPGDYAVEVTPPPYSEQFDDESFPNPWDDHPLAPSDSLSRLRARSAAAAVPDARDGALANGSGSLVAFPEPQLYRSASYGSTLPRRPSSTGRSNGAASIALHSHRSVASVVSSTSFDNQEDEYASVEVALREADDLSQELSNLSLDSEDALHRFQAGELLEKDQAWHRLVPLEARDALGKEEVQRQSVIFEVFKAEREYVSDLEAVEEVFIKGLQETSPPIIPESRLQTFISDVFGNLATILAHHQRMLAALFARQREQHPLVQSVADIILDTVLLSEFRTDYEAYIKHYPLSESLHRKELRHNTAYQAFLGSIAADPRVRRRDLITFLSRPVTRLPRLNLVLEQVLKLTDKDYDHPDLETLPIILGILGEFIKSTQPGIEAAESKVKFGALSESLVFQQGEIIDMDLYDESRTVVYSGPLSRVTQSSMWSELTGFLLDNFFLLTREEKWSNGQEKRHIMSHPIHLSYLRLGSFTSAPHLRKEKIEDAGLLDSFRSAPTVPVYPFTIYHASSRSTRRYTLYVASEGVRKRWYLAFLDAIGVHKVRQDANMWFYQQTLTDEFFRVIPSSITESSVMQRSRRITTAAPFSSGGRKFLAVGCTAGVYVSPRGLEDYRQVIPFLSPSALAAIQTIGSKSYSKLIIYCNNSLFALPLDIIVEVALGTTEPHALKIHMERIVSQDSPVYFFRSVQTGERVLIIYGTKRLLQLSMDLQVIEAIPRSPAAIRSPQRMSQSSFRLFNEPTNIPRDAYDVSPLTKMVGICSKDGITIMDPTNLSKSTPAVVPIFGDASASPLIRALKARLHKAKPLGLVRVTSGELIVIYNLLGCYITKRGVPSRSAGFIIWETPAVSHASRGKHLLLFSEQFIEVRDLNTGRIVQVIEGTDIRLLHSGGPLYGEYDTILVAMKGTKDDKDGTSEKIVELVETSEISSAPVAASPAMWDEWDM